MVEISIINRPKKFNRKTIKDAIEFSTKELINPQLSRNVSIQVKFIKGLLKGEHKVYGYCDYEDNSPYNPRNFILEIDHDLTTQMTFRTIFHELTHVQQFATGKMKDLTATKVKWCGKVLKLNPKKYMTKKYGNKLPFEKEALKLEKQLYRKIRQETEILYGV